VDLWLFRLHGRLIWGRLSQSAFSPETAAAGVRFGTGIVLDVTSRWSLASSWASPDSRIDRGLRAARR